MDIKMSPTSPIRDGGIRKRMRKGTHSCFECRRRKIRCIFSPNNQRVCTECFARGSQCIDQEHADPSVVLDQRKNLRERVARLEDLVNSILDDKPDSKASLAIASLRTDGTPPTPHSGDSLSPSSGAPMFVFPISYSYEDANLESAWNSMHDKTSAHHQTNVAYEPKLHIYPISQAQRKNEHVIHALKSLLPPAGKLYKVLDQNREWWKNITTAMVGPGGTPKHLTDIHAFAEYALTVGSPTDVAKVLHLTISHVDLENHQIESILERIDHLIVNDDEYMGTLPGVEVAQQQARHFGDIGQSRRAWLTIRRAVSFAQLMGLNRSRVNVRQDLCFWGLYQFDRFSSLILGVPYSLADAHCNLTFRAKSLPIVWESQHFLTHLAILAGKVIDRTHGPLPAVDSESKDSKEDKDKSFNSLVAIDQELVDLKAKMPLGYWELEPLAPTEFLASANWMQRSVSLVMWNQTRLILHLPNLFRSSSVTGQSTSSQDASTSEFSRKICLEISRSTLSVLQILRDPENSFAYKTMAVDFLSVIASVVLVIDILTERNHPSATSNIQSLQQEKERQADWDLVQSSHQMFVKAEEMPLNKIAVQGCKVLSQLLNFRDPKSDHSEPSKIMIPFFGTITIYSGRVHENNIPSAGGNADVTAASLPKDNTESSSRLSGQSKSTYSTSNSNQTAINKSSSYSHSQATIPKSQSLSSGASPLAPLLHNTGVPQSNISTMQHSSPHFAIPQSPVPASVFEPQVAYDGVYLPYENTDYVTSGLQGMSARVPSGYLPSGWQSVGTFDLDQDWGWLMSDAPG